MVEIRVKNDTVIAFSNDWKSLTDNERSFFQKCYFHAIWTAFDDDGNLVMQSVETSIKKAWLISRVVELAKSLKIDVSVEVEDLLDRLRKAQKKDEERAKTAREIEMLQLRWKARKKSACNNCQYCEQTGDGCFRCRYSGDELDVRMIDRWDVLNGVYELFHETGEPNEHCKDYYEEKIVKRTEN